MPNQPRDAESPVDAGAGADAGYFCNINGAPDASFATWVSGSIVGPGLDAVVNPGGAHAYLERTPGSISVAAGFWLAVFSNLSLPASSTMTIQVPSDATGSLLTAFVAVSSPTPGTYTSSDLSTCSGIAFCAWLPVPASVDCADGGETECPPGCALQGPVMAPTCLPVAPELCFSADGTDCAGESLGAQGSWTVTLTSVTPCADNPASDGDSLYVVHGSLTATLVGDADAGTAPATLSLSF
jgi:hypothetical protein